ncbi:MAG: transglycosylase domain-containing protein [Roseiarcus sp.]
MSNELQRSALFKAIGRALLAADAFVDSSLYRARRRAIAAYASASAFFDRFHVSGVAKFAVEIACEGLTLGLAGALVALALALPAFRETSDDDWLKREDLAVTFLDRYGVEVGRRGIKHDDSIPLEQLPDHFIKAVLATEDRRFFSHFGIDVVGTLRALTVNARASSVVQGGSSITQQLAKNLFLTNERSLDRKVKEAYLALWLEHHLSKKEILKLYLDRAYMGGGAFGVQAAAQFYFGKSARDIDLAQSAMLAGLFKAPTKYSPDVNLPAARARANDVLSNLVDAGFMTEGQVYAARRNPATPVDHGARGSPDYYLDFAYDEVKGLADDGKLGKERVLVVRTGLDTGLQRKAEGVIEDMLRVRAPAYHAHQAATVVAEPNGLVRAMVGGRDYGASQFNRATEALRQPGSSFKIFDYLTAILTGKYHKDTPVDASGICIGDYCVHNFAGESAGMLPLYSALAQSLNTAAIRMSVKIGEVYWPAGKSYHLGKIAELGRNKIVATARAMGLTTPLPDTVSLPIGADDVRMIDMLAANALLANGGKRATPYAAIEIRNPHGDLIYSRDANGPPPVQVIPADKIAEMNNILTHVVTEGTGRAAQLPGIVAAGKTGTTNNSTNAWFNGFTGNFVCSVWFGNDDNSPMPGMVGGLLPAMTWHEIMLYAHQGVDIKPPYGVAPAPLKAPEVAAAGQSTGDEPKARRPVGLSTRAAELITEIGDLARVDRSRGAERKLPVSFAAQTAPSPGIWDLSAGAAHP